MPKAKSIPPAPTPHSNHPALEKIMEEYTSRLEEKLLQEVQFVGMLSDAMPQIVWTALPEGEFDYFNKRWYEYTEIPESETHKNGWFNIVHPDDYGKAKHLWANAVKTASPFEAELRFKNHESDDYRWFLVRAVLGRDKNDKPLKWFGTATDIDDHKRDQAKKDEFIAITSHELKTPLTSLKAYAQLLQMNTAKMDKKSSRLAAKEIDKQVGRLNSLINDLLDVSLLDTGKLKLNRSKFDFDKFTKRTVRSMQIITPTHKLIVKGKTGAKVLADKQRIEQVLANLVSNASKYSPNADKIIIKLAKDKDNVKLSVIDYGLGIPKSDRKNIFNRFFRSSSSRYATFSGFGLGLYITSEILKREGGGVAVKSHLGKGSDFSFWLPIAGSSSV